MYKDYKSSILMKNFFSVIVIFAILLIGGGFVYMRNEAELQRQRMVDNTAKARRDFAHKARSAVTDDDNDGYLRTVKAAISSYKDDLNRTVYREQPEAQDTEKYLKAVEARFEKGELDESRRKNMLEGFEVTRDAYETLMSTSWKPIFTQRGKADTRLDIYSVRRVEDPNGRPLLEAKFFFWGIEDSTNVRWGDLEMRLWKKETTRRRKEEDRVHGKVEGDSQPRILIQKPHNYIADFPSFVSIGSIWLPVLPKEAETFDFSYSYTTSHNGGGEVESKLQWKRFKIPGGWKLGAGEAWDADEVEATEEELRGQDDEPEEEEEDLEPQAAKVAP